MVSKSKSFRKAIYLLISVILPIVLIIVNHAIWIDNIILSILLMTWMGFSMLALQPFDTGKYETIEP